MLRRNALRPGSALAIGPAPEPASMTLAPLLRVERPERVRRRGHALTGPAIGWLAVRGSIQERVLIRLGQRIEAAEPRKLIGE